MIRYLTPSLAGARVTCKINGKFVKNARIQHSHGGYYICQNSHNGDPCDDKLGYKFSWSIATGSSEETLKQMGVTELALSVTLWDEEENR